MKKIVFSLVVFVFVFSGLYAGGKKDNEEINIESLESWDETMDISQKKKGKYNILITAKDIAGNDGVYGPFNMYIDPKSDLPIAHISSPMDESRVVGNVNVVGTCIDDDAVEYVELRIDDGEEVYRAKGKEFWSYYIDTSNLEEGPHTIEAWGVDINGVQGKSVKTVFNLDRRQPLTSVGNKVTGELVSGKITLSGVVDDGNGIERLLYSLDDGQTFEEIKVSYSRKTSLYSFKLNINTKEIEDGPKVCWFKAVDMQGSVGIYTFLFFVDNTPPSVEFVYPGIAGEGEEEESFPSVFSVAGKSSDTVGLESLKWSCGKKEGEFEITPGNQYWAKEFDLSQESGKSATVIITATDLAGNVVSERKVVPIDRNKDKPKIQLLSPKPEERIVSDLFISGFSYDKYGTSEIRYKIDKGSEKVLETEFGGFGALEQELPAGQHTLSIYAVNSKGMKGDPIEVVFMAGGMAPSITFENNQTVIDSFTSRSKISTSANIVASAGLQELLVGYNGEEPTPIQIKNGVTSYSVKNQVTSKSLPGIYTMTVVASDVQGRVTRQNLVIRVIDISGTSGDENFVWAIGNQVDGSSALMVDGKPISAVYQPKTGAAIESAEVVGGSGFTAEVEGNLIKLYATKDGSYKGVAVKITDTNGETYTSPAINVFSDTSVPAINLSIEENPSFVKNSLVLKGSAEDGAGIRSVEYSLGEGSEPRSLKTSFNKTINLSGENDGPILLKIKAIDRAGREAIAYRVLYKDTEPPIARMIQPAEGDSVNGSILSSFRLDDVFANIKAEYRNSSKSDWEEFEYNSLPHKEIGTADKPISKKMQFRFTDIAGNSMIYNNYGFNIDNSQDIPVVELHLPAENEVIFKDFEISGIVYDDDAPAKLYYKIDNGEYTEMEIKNSFAIPMSLSSFTDNEHIITIYAEDIYGVKSAPVNRKIRVSLNLPTAEVVTPVISETVKEIITISGTASDKNGIKMVEVSVDNGTTFNLAKGTKNWKFVLNTHVIDDGTHVVFVRTTDNYDQKSIFSTLVNIDNTSPVLKFEYPLQGSKLDKNLFVSGQTYDNISLEGVTLRIKSLDGKRVPSKLENISLKTELLVARDIDISSLSEGKYNLEISGVDKANNITDVSVNFSVYRKKDKDRVELLYPLNGKKVRGEFNIYARIISDKKVEQAGIYVDGNELGLAEVSTTNYVSFKLNSELISNGKHKIEVRGFSVGGKVLTSNIHDIEYEAEGPWITVDNFAMGDFAIERPYLRGRSGYTISEEEKERVNSKEASSEEKRAFKAKRLDRIEISFDNGKTFEELKYSKKKGWKYRIETGFMAEGNHFLLVRAIMENKEVATCRTIIRIDKTVPNITLISPGEGGRYNDTINFVGLASDDIELASVKAALRKGDKASYGVPAFIQGLHFETAFWGASLWNIGVGLSFFDNNVKVQFHYGQFLQSQFNVLYAKEPLRYGGHVISFKLLANVVQVPFGYYFGPDWNWLYLTASLGAQFSLFTQTQSGKPQVLSSILMQMEFPRVKLYKQKYFSSFSFFTEGQLWFVPTDVSSDKKTSSKKKGIKSIIPHISCGVRVDVF